MGFFEVAHTSGAGRRVQAIGGGVDKRKWGAAFEVGSSGKESGTTENESRRKEMKKTRKVSTVS